MAGLEGQSDIDIPVGRQRVVAELTLDHIVVPVFRRPVQVLWTIHLVQDGPKDERRADRDEVKVRVLLVHAAPRAQLRLLLPDAIRVDRWTSQALVICGRVPVRRGEGEPWRRVRQERGVDDSGKRRGEDEPLDTGLLLRSL